MMKRIIAVIMVLTLCIGLCACGTKQGLTFKNISEKTTLEQIKKSMANENKNVYDVEDEDCYCLVYDDGATFAGINTSYLEIYFRPQEKTLMQVLFDFAYERTNKEVADSMVDELTKKYGSPKIENNSFGTEYIWDYNTPRYKSVFIRESGNSSATLYYDWYENATD